MLTPPVFVAGSAVPEAFQLPPLKRNQARELMRSTAQLIVLSPNRSPKSGPGQPPSYQIFPPLAVTPQPPLNPFPSEDSVWLIRPKPKPVVPPAILAKVASK